MKQVFLVILSALLILCIIYVVGTGFMERTNVVLFDYAISEDGSVLTMHVGVMSSMGYTRGYRDNGGGVKPHYLTFYAAFGGLNGSIGAKNVYELELSESDTEIWFNRSDGGYELVLQKDRETGVWEKTNK